MTHDEAVKKQKRLATIWGEESLGWWFGTKCEKCCDVYPRFCTRDTNDKYHNCCYKCDVCGKQTDYYGMPSQCEEAWNNHQYMGAGVQLSFI